MNEKLVADCLSSWEIAQNLVGDASFDRRQVQHLAECTNCFARMRVAQQVQSASAGSVMPLTLLRPLEPRRRIASVRTLTAGFTALAAACLLVAFLPAQREETLVQSKGSVSLLATVMRDDALVLDDQPIEQMPHLHQGDRLRLRVVSAGEPSDLQIEVSDDAGGWNTVYTGPEPHDKWIPMGIRILSAASTDMKVRVCDHGHKACEEHIFHL